MSDVTIQFGGQPIVVEYGERTSLAVASAQQAVAAQAAAETAAANVTNAGTVFATATGLGNAIILTRSGGASVGGVGQRWKFSAIGPNTGNVSVNFGAGDVPLYLPDGRHIPVGFIVDGRSYEVVRESASARLVSPAYVPRATNVILAQTNSSGSAVTAKLAVDVAMDAGFYDTEFSFIAKADRTAAGASITIRNATDTATLLNQSLYMPDFATQIPEKTWKAGDIVRFVRDRATDRLGLSVPPDLVTKKSTRTRNVAAGFGLLPSPIRPLHVARVSENLYQINMRLPDAAYIGGRERQASDNMVVVLANHGALNGYTGFAINSILSRVAGAYCHHSNFAYEEIVSSIIGDTGLTPSLFEGVTLFVGAPDYAGLAHGGTSGTTGPITYSLSGIQNDATTSNVDVATALNTLAVNGDFKGVRVSISLAFDIFLPAPGLAKGARQTINTTIAPGNAYPVQVESIWDFTVAAGAANVTRIYGQMLPCRDVNRAVGVVAGVEGAVKPLSVGNPDPTFGNAERIIAWHTAQPYQEIEICNLLGVGNAYQEDGVNKPYNGAGNAVINSYGPKIYMPLEFGGANLAGKVIRTLTGYRTNARQVAR